MTKVQQDDGETTFELTIADNRDQNNCTPLWMYQGSAAFIDLNGADKLPDGFATSLGYGERFRNGEVLPLFTYYPILILLVILASWITLGGIIYAIYRWRMGIELKHFLHCKISKEFRIWFVLSLFFVVLICMLIIVAVYIMLKANNNISEVGKERSWRLQLAKGSIHKIIKDMEDVKFEEPLENFNQLSLKLQRAIEKESKPHLEESKSDTEQLDFLSYKNDIEDLLETFAHCNAYMLHFLDSWRFYDTNATKYAKAVDTMDSRKALDSLRRVRQDFANVVYKVIQQNRAFYNYYGELENLSSELLKQNATRDEEKLNFTNIVNTHLDSIENKLDVLGIKMRARTRKIKEIMKSLNHISNGAGYIEFPDALLVSGYFVCILLLVIVFLALLFMPLRFTSRYCHKCDFFGGVLPLTTAALIFVCYVIFVVVIIHYFLYGMVSRDGICKGKRSSTSPKSNIIDDCLNNSTIFSLVNATSAAADFGINSTDIEALFREIADVPKRVKRKSAAGSSKEIAKFHINKTVIQDIYVEMLKVSVYAPKNIESFARIWYANRQSQNKLLQELNCTHAIGNTMVKSLHGQVASEMDKLYRKTWHLEAMLIDLPRKFVVSGDALAKSSDESDLSGELRTIFNEEKETLEMSVQRTSSGNMGDCKPVARLYKTLATAACECLVPSMNLFWSAAFAAICLLVLLFVLLLCLEEILRRSCSHGRNAIARLKRRNTERARERSRAGGRSRTRGQSRSREGSRASEESQARIGSRRSEGSRSERSRSERSRTQDGSRTREGSRIRAGSGTREGSRLRDRSRDGEQYRMRERSRTRSTSRTELSTRSNTPYSTHAGTPYSQRSIASISTRADTPQSIRDASPYFIDQERPYLIHPATPQISRPDTPYSTLPGTPHSSRHGMPFQSQHVLSYLNEPETPRSIHPRSRERTPTRGTSLALKHPPDYDPFSNYYNSVKEDPFVERFAERLSRRDVLPRYQQRKHHYPSLGNREIKDFPTFESYPEMPAVIQQQSKPEREQERENTHRKPKRVRKIEGFRYPGRGSSDMSTIPTLIAPRSISKVLQRRATSQPNEKSRSAQQSNPNLLTLHKQQEEASEAPSTSRATVENKMQPGKVGIVLCPCGCGKPAKIYGTKEDIEKIRKAGRICIAKRGEHLQNKSLKSLASILQLTGSEQNEDVA